MGPDVANFKPSDIDPTNKANLEKLESGGQIGYAQAGGVVAIGPGHKKEVVDALKFGHTGKIRIIKGKGTDPGKVEVTGCHGKFHFEKTIKRISNLAVVFK
jgi:hypothetical protein